MVCVPERKKEHETILRVRAKAYVIHTALLALGLENGIPVEYAPEFKAPSGTPMSLYVSWLDEQGDVQRADIRSWVRHNIHRYYAEPLKMPPPNIELPWKELRYDKFTSELLWYGPMTAAERDELLSKWNDQQYQAAVRAFFRDSQSRPMQAQFVFVGSQFYSDPQSGRKQYGAEGGHLICVSNFGDAMIDVREESTSADGAQVYEGWEEKIPPEDTPVILELIPKKSKTATSSGSQAGGSR